jgi:(1->4)-alpha-D-glucan 1-alpha-D-glucosylmutase
MGSLPAMIADAKREIVKESLSSEVHRLATIAHTICTTDVRLRDHTWRSLYDCLRTLIVAFDRYRAYVVPGVQPKPTSVEAIDHAAERARVELDPERHETLEVVVDLLKGREVGSAGRTNDVNRSELITRFQQACGAVMAKGVEDTAYYRWTHLLPLCEVGSPAGRFALSPAAFHAWASDQQQLFPHAMTCLSTHDTKRSEDVRARLGVLSEAPEMWDTLVTKLQETTAEMRPAILDGRTENLWWQTLAGASDESTFMEWDRLEGYLTKAMREAKTHTTWTDVNSEYETAVLWFAQTTHADLQVRDLLREWHASVAPAVRAATLAMKLIQLTMPGVPDVYQGTETVNPTLVDPDNRRALDFSALSNSLKTVSGRAKPKSLADEKLLVTARALQVRRDHSAAFIGDAAGYLPLPSSSGNAVVFARTVKDSPEVITVATRASLEASRLGGWQEHTVQLPEGVWKNVLTRTTMEGGATPLATLLKSLPVALLVRA